MLLLLGQLEHGFKSMNVVYYKTDSHSGKTLQLVNS